VKTPARIPDFFCPTFKVSDGRSGPFAVLTCSAPFASQAHDLGDPYFSATVIRPIRKDVAFETEIFDRPPNRINSLIVANLRGLACNLIGKIEHHPLPPLR